MATKRKIKEEEEEKEMLVNGVQPKGRQSKRMREEVGRLADVGADADDLDIIKEEVEDLVGELLGNGAQPEINPLEMKREEVETLRNAGADPDDPGIIILQTHEAEMPKSHENMRNLMKASPESGLPGNSSTSGEAKLGDSSPDLFRDSSPDLFVFAGICQPNTDSPNESNSNNNDIFSSGDSGNSNNNKPYVETQPESNQEQKDGLPESEEPLSFLGDLIGSQIPKHIPLPVPSRIQANDTDVHRMVTMGVESTSLNFDCNIIQITCSSFNREIPDFNRYILPEKEIHRDATRVNGMTFINGVLRQNGRKVQALSLREVLEELIDYLQKDTVLISHNIYLQKDMLSINHNIRYSQSHQLVRNVLKVGLIEGLCEKVVGFSDTHALFLEMYPRSKGKILGSYNLWNLVKYFSANFYDRNFECPDMGKDNMKKTRNLAQLLRFHNLNLLKLYPHSSTIDCVIKQVSYQNMRWSNERTFHFLVEHKFFCKGMAKRFASSGLNLDHFEMAYTRAGFEGLLELINPRLTKSHAVIHSIWQYFSTKVSIEESSLT